VLVIAMDPQIAAPSTSNERIDSSLPMMTSMLALLEGREPFERRDADQLLRFDVRRARVDHRRDDHRVCRAAVRSRGSRPDDLLGTPPRRWRPHARNGDRRR